MARPKNNKKTEQKTYMFLEEDIAYMLRVGLSPKALFHIGCQAHMLGFIPGEAHSKVNDLKERVESLERGVSNWKNNTERLKGIIAKVYKLNTTEMSIKDIEAQVEDLESQRKQLTKVRKNK